MVHERREQAIAALKSSAYNCHGNCGLTEEECYQKHPIITSSLRGEEVISVDADISALVSVVFAAIGLSPDGCGAKAPAQCKFCSMPCACGSH